MIALICQLVVSGPLSTSSVMSGSRLLNPRRVISGKGMSKLRPEERSSFTPVGGDTGQVRGPRE